MAKLNILRPFRMFFKYYIIDSHFEHCLGFMHNYKFFKSGMFYQMCAYWTCKKHNAEWNILKHEFFPTLYTLCHIFLLIHGLQYNTMHIVFYPINGYQWILFQSPLNTSTKRNPYVWSYFIPHSSAVYHSRTR